MHTGSEQGGVTRARNALPQPGNEGGGGAGLKGKGLADKLTVRVWEGAGKEGVLRDLDKRRGKGSALNHLTAII